MVDIGWPGTIGRMLANLKRMDIPINEIRYTLATHYHIDHAGLGEEFKQAGVPLLVLENQLLSIPLMKTWIKPQDNYQDITMDGNVVISCEDSRETLSEIGIPGEIIHTPGHSPDSVSLLLDNGSVFTGDLTRPEFIGLEDPAVVHASWRLLKDSGAEQVYPGHGPSWLIEKVNLSG